MWGHPSQQQKKPKLQKEDEVASIEKLEKHEILRFEI